MTIRTLLAPTIATCETRVDSPAAEIFPDEARCVARAVDQRRREFATGRACARTALQQLGIAAVAIPGGASGEPVWPAGIVGSITHCPGYRACAVARRVDHASVGIDAEPHAPLPAGVLDAVASRAERSRLHGNDGGVRLDRVLFSIKETVFKAWFGLTRVRLGFEDADVTIDARHETFRARLASGCELVGSWGVGDGLVLTALVIPAADAAGRV